jgi:hypothetical protein
MTNRALLSFLNERTPNQVVIVGRVGTGRDNLVLSYANLCILTRSARSDRPLVIATISWGSSDPHDGFVEGQHKTDLLVELSQHSSGTIGNDELLDSLIVRYNHLSNWPHPSTGWSHLIDCNNRGLICAAHPQLLQLWASVIALIDHTALTNHEWTLIQRLRALVTQANRAEAQRHCLP